MADENNVMKTLATLILWVGAALGRRYEIGADIGYGFYRSGTVFSNSGSAQAGIRNRFAAGIFV
jgi:hypothetical protein